MSALDHQSEQVESSHESVEYPTEEQEESENESEEEYLSKSGAADLSDDQEEPTPTTVSGTPQGKEKDFKAVFESDNTQQSKTASSLDLRRDLCSQNLFVFHLPSEWREADLTEAFCKFGKILSVKVVKRPDMTSKGYGFVCFESPDAAQAAVTAMDGFAAGGGKRLKVSIKKTPEECLRMQVHKLMKMSEQDQEFDREKDCSLFVFHLPPHWEDHDLKKHFAPYGPVIAAKVSRKEDGTSRGYGFVTCGDPKSAALAIMKLNGFEVCNKRLKVQPKQMGSSAHPRPECTVFVFHLPNDWNDALLKQYFSHCGKVVSATVQRDPKGKSRGFGFVTYERPQSARDAVEDLNGSIVGAKRLKVSLKRVPQGHSGPTVKGRQNEPPHMRNRPTGQSHPSSTTAVISAFTALSRSPPPDHLAHHTSPPPMPHPYFTPGVMPPAHHHNMYGQPGGTGGGHPPPPSPNHHLLYAHPHQAIPMGETSGRRHHGNLHSEEMMHNLMPATPPGPGIFYPPTNEWKNEGGGGGGGKTVDLIDFGPPAAIPGDFCVTGRPSDYPHLVGRANATNQMPHHPHMRPPETHPQLQAVASAAFAYQHQQQRAAALWSQSAAAIPYATTHPSLASAASPQMPNRTPSYHHHHHHHHHGTMAQDALPSSATRPGTGGRGTVRI